jgi:hypothetical protein
LNSTPGVQQGFDKCSTGNRETDYPPLSPAEPTQHKPGVDSDDDRDSHHIQKQATAQGKRTPEEEVCALQAELQNTVKLWSNDRIKWAKEKADFSFVNLELKDELEAERAATRALRKAHSDAEERLSAELEVVRGVLASERTFKST